MIIKRQDERTASAALAKLLQVNATARKAFFSLVFNGSVPKPLLGHPDVYHSYRTDRGQEMDLVIQSTDHAIIVECKVRDTQKVYQLHAYRDAWLRVNHVDPVLVWLVQKSQKLIGADELKVRTLTWNALRRVFKDAADKGPLCDTSAIDRFNKALERADIVLSHDTKLTKRRFHKGYDASRACKILSAIKKSAPDMTGRIVQTNELSPALHVGRPEWASIFDDLWTQRVWLYFQPRTKTINQHGPFYFHGQILLYHKRQCKEPFRENRRTLAHMKYLRSHRLQIWRNRPGKWKGRELVDTPFQIKAPVNYLYAAETENAAMERFPFDWTDERAAIRAGAAHLSQFVKWVERLNQVTIERQS